MTAPPNCVVFSAFYRGDGVDHKGRRIEDVLRLSVREMEETHDYIQWLFPLTEPSSVSMHAPVLGERCIATLTDDPHFRATLRRAFDKMLGFYGLKLIGAGPTARITKAAFYERQARNWLTPDNHNFMRLTRIMRSMVLFSEHVLARALLFCLQEIAGHSPEIVSANAQRHWRQAVPEFLDEARE